MPEGRLFPAQALTRRRYNPEDHGGPPNRELDPEPSGKERAGGSLNLIRKPLKLPQMKPVKR